MMPELSDAQWYTLGAIGLLTLCSLITRTAYFLFGHYLPLSDAMRRALRYAPAAALLGIIVPGLLPLSTDGTMTVAIDQIIGALVGILVYLRTGRTPLVIVLGMLAFWTVRFLFSLFPAGTLA